jgi:hypothetical protein
MEEAEDEWMDHDKQIYSLIDSSVPITTHYHTVKVITQQDSETLHSKILSTSTCSTRNCPTTHSYSLLSNESELSYQSSVLSEQRERMHDMGITLPILTPLDLVAHLSKYILLYGCTLPGFPC